MDHSDVINKDEGSLQVMRLVLIAIACAWQVRVLAVNVLKKMKTNLPNT